MSRAKTRSAPGSVRAWAFGLSGAVFVFFLVVWEHVEDRALQKEVSDLQKEADRLTYSNGLLRTQIHQWISPSHLDGTARKDYQMAPADPSHVIGIQAK